MANKKRIILMVRMERVFQVEEGMGGFFMMVFILLNFNRIVIGLLLDFRKIDF